MMELLILKSNLSNRDTRQTKLFLFILHFQNCAIQKMKESFRNEMTNDDARPYLFQMVFKDCAFGFG